MWQKIKKIFLCIWSVLVIIGCTLFLLFRRRDSEGLGSEGDAERDSEIKGGFDSCTDRAERIEEGSSRTEERITRAEERAEQCREHLQRAEDILREAIKRSEQG